MDNRRLLPRTSFRRFDTADRSSGYPERTESKADGGILAGLHLEFTADHVCARVYLDDRHGTGGDPNEPTTDVYGARSDSAGFDCRDNFAGFAFDTLNSTVAFIEDPY